MQGTAYLWLGKRPKAIAIYTVILTNLSATIKDTLAGFYTPSYLSSVSVPGLHLHFISDDFEHGGHLISCRPNGIKVGVQFIHSLKMDLPMSLDYLNCDFKRDTAKDLDKAEK